jgi:hypothetical protein
MYYLSLGDGKVLQATIWFRGIYDLEPLLPLLLERLLLRAHGGPLGGGPHDNGYVESQILRGRLCVVGAAQEQLLVDSAVSCSHSLILGKKSQVFSNTLMPNQAGPCVAELRWLSLSMGREKMRVVTLMRGPCLQFEDLSRWQTAWIEVSASPVFKTTFS